VLQTWVGRRSRENFLFFGGKVCYHNTNFMTVEREKVPTK